MARGPILALLLVLAVSACGSTAKTAGPGPGSVLFEGSEWAVVVDHGHATAQRLVDREWKADTSGAVHVTVLGPRTGSSGNPATPQVAAELSATSRLIESGLWVDGVEIQVKGGGLTPTRGTIYGAPATPLESGKHVAVAYGRTATHATAVAWTFSVR